MSKGALMNLSKMLSPDRVVDLISSKKDNVLKELIQVMSTSKAVGNKLDLYKAICERESMGSTGIGHGVAVPHAKSATISEFVIALGRKPEGIQFESPDGQLVNLVIMIGAPENCGDDLLKLLAKIVLMSKNAKFRRKVLDSKSKTDVAHSFKD